jgi:hypothetical protein
VRFRDEKPGDLDRAREAVAAWRGQNPQGTPDEMLAAIGGRFRAEWGIVLRGVLFAVDRNRGRQVTGIVTGPAGAGR